MAILAATVVLLGAAAAGGMASAKQQPVIAPIDLPLGATVENRIWVEDIMPVDQFMPIESCSWGGSQTVASGGGGATGRATFDELHITSHISSASPLLAKACATGQHIKKVIVEDFSFGARMRGNETLYLRITLEDVLITGYQVGGSSGSDTLPMEEISFAFAKITYEYVGTDPSRSTVFSYDLSDGTA